MNKKKIALVIGASAVAAACLVYSLRIYPPAAGRDTQGAIGQRQVYRADQAKDATVSPGEAPVAAKAEIQQARINDKGAFNARSDNDKGMFAAKPDNDKGYSRNARPDNDKGYSRNARPDNDRQ